MQKNADTEHCAVQVRKYDYERYFSALLVPSEVRRGLFALYAFNIELASIRERVTENLLGEIRLEWWRNNIKEIYAGNVRNHSVTVELAHTIEHFNIELSFFERLISARVFDMNDEPPEDLNALENYVTMTSGELMVCSCIIAGASVGKDTALAMGRYWGLTGIIRSIQFHATMGRVYLPKDLMREAGLGSHQVVENCFSSRVDIVVGRLAERLIKYEKDLPVIDKNSRPPFAYLSIARHYLRRLRKASFKRDGRSPELSQFMKQLVILKTAINGKL